VFFLWLLSNFFLADKQMATEGKAISSEACSNVERGLRWWNAHIYVSTL